MVIPLSITLKDWADSLVIDFPDDDIPLLYNEENWQDWGNFLIQATSFAENDAPATSSFPDWKEWALSVFNQMANF